MALSERSKWCLTWSTQILVKLCGIDRVCREVTPADLVDKSINGKSKGSDTSLNIKANRDEAEKLVAGILGLNG